MREGLCEKHDDLGAKIGRPCDSFGSVVSGGAARLFACSTISRGEDSKTAVIACFHARPCVCSRRRLRGEYRVNVRIRASMRAEYDGDDFIVLMVVHINNMRSYSARAHLLHAFVDESFGSMWRHLFQRLNDIFTAWKMRAPLAEVLGFLRALQDEPAVQRGHPPQRLLLCFSTLV